MAVMHPPIIIEIPMYKKEQSSTDRAVFPRCAKTMAHIMRHTAQSMARAIAEEKTKKSDTTE
jgi:hypothetical protein